jgi:DNA modification methylase
MNQSTVWEIGRENDKIHPTQKPVELFSIPIKNHMKPGQVVYEPFCGSGSGMIAAEKESVKCRAMELSPNYCDVIVARWEKYTGKKAELIG